jgi:leucyl aminopeptidase
MSVAFSTTETLQKTEVLVLPVFEKKSEVHFAYPLGKEAEAFCHQLFKQEQFSGKLNETLMLFGVPHLKATRLLCIGCGEAKSFDLKDLKTIVKKATSLIKSYSSATFALPDLSAYSAARITTEALIDGLYQFTHYQSEENAPKAPALKKVSLLTSTPGEAETGISHGKIIGEATRYVKDLGNTPGNEMTPAHLAEEAKKLAKKSKKISLKILDEKDLLKKKMLGLLSVGKGSINPPRMILLNYKGGKKTDPHLALVGKGITFDSGGISLKPGDHMWDMKMDMLGAGTLLGVLQAAVLLNLPLNISVTIAAAENMPSGNAYKPGDIVRTYSGKTIEVLNTDAEGRVVLSDAVTYAQELYQPERLIDIATLTGACITALGHEYTGAITNHQPTCDAILEAGKAALDEAWQLPINDNFRKLVKSAIADLANMGPKGQARTIIGAAFIEAFVDKTVHWVHLDIAGTAMGKEASGRPVAMLVQYLLNQVNK